MNPPDQTHDGQALKLFNVVDEYTREALVMLVERRIDSDRTVSTLVTLVARHGAPELIRCDNGPELTAHTVRDWCRFSGAGTSFIHPGPRGRTPTWRASTPASPTELLDLELFDSLREAQVVIEDLATGLSIG